VRPSAQGVAGRRDSPAAFLEIASEEAALGDPEADRPARAEGGLAPEDSAAAVEGGQAAGRRRLIEESPVAALYEVHRRAAASSPEGSAGSAGMSIVVAKPTPHDCAAFSALEDEADRRVWAQHVPPLMRPRTRQLVREIQDLGHTPRRGARRAR